MFVALERTGKLVRSHGAKERAVVLQGKRIADVTPDLLGEVDVGEEVSFGWLWDHAIQGFDYDETRYRDTREETAAWAIGLTPQMALLGPHRVVMKDPGPWEIAAADSGPCRFAESEVALWSQGSLLFGRREGRFESHERFSRDPGDLPLELLGDRFPRLGCLKRYGMVTFRDAWRLSGEELGQFLGGGGEALLRILRGEVSLFRPEPPPMPPTATVPLGEATSLGEVLAGATRAARWLGSELQRRNLAARRLFWRIEGEDWRREGEVALLRPSADGARLGAVAGRELMRSSLEGPASRLILRASRTEPAVRQLNGLFVKEPASSPTAAVDIRRREERLTFFDPWRGGREREPCHGL